MSSRYTTLVSSKSIILLINFGKTSPDVNFTTFDRLNSNSYIPRTRDNRTAAPFLALVWRQVFIRYLLLDFVDACAIKSSAS
jgi:hypothetical protein